MMKPGDVIRLTYFRHYDSPAAQFDYRAPKDKVFLAVLIGVENKDGSDPADPLELLKLLGWEMQGEPEGFDETTSSID